MIISMATRILVVQTLPDFHPEIYRKPATRQITAVLRRQKIYGAILILFSIVYFVLAFWGSSGSDRELMPVLFTLPLGLWLLLSKKEFLTV